MAYLSPFEYDIFISYARINDQPKPGSSFRWVKHFEECLNYAFEQEFGERGLIKIWRDEGEVGGSTYFDEAIKDGINKSALFIALFSSAYIKREYCLKELEWFYRKAEREPYKLAISTRFSRLFNIRLQNIPPTLWPDELSGKSGFKFHDDQPLSESLPPGAEYNARLRELAEELVLTLRAFKGLIVQNQTEERAARATHTVFLAHTEGRMRDVSRRLASELTQAEVEVVTRIPPPDEAAEHEQKVEAVLKRADLAVHLLDDAPGLEVQDDPEKFYSWEQLRLGLRHARSQLIWVPDTVKVEAVEDAGQRKLLDLLEKRDLAALEGIGFGASQDATRPAYSFVHEPKDALKRIIMDKLEEVARAAAAQDEGDSSDNSQPVAFLDLHQKDSRFAHDLGPVFIERGVEVRIVPEGDSPRSNDSRFENSLKQASIFLVIFGQVSADWVRERLNRALQIMVREKCALSLWGVYAPPIDGAPGARQFTPPTPPRGSLRPYCIDSPENLNVILKAMGVNP